MKKVALVVPSIRENSWNRFVEEWDKAGLFEKVDVYLVEDNPNKTFQTKENFKHFCWKDIDNTFKEDRWIIPRRSDTVRSFGYYKAWKDGYEFILTLDDDCYPNEGHENLVDMHLSMLENRSKWFNTLNDVKPRGIPFYNYGKGSRKIYVNHGLWTHVLDYDAPTQLAAPVEEKFSYDNRIVPQNSYFPMCGMNVMWRAEATVLMYHLLMGQQLVTFEQQHGIGDDKLIKLPFDRFGDIWCGIFMKKIADFLGWNVSTGVPYIHHDRASNVFTNLKKEANGLEVNEKLWQIVDEFKMRDISASEDAVRWYAYLGIYLGNKCAEQFPEYKKYFQDLSSAMQIWASYFNE